MTENYDIELIRIRLTTLGISTDVTIPYLALLSNLNALNILLMPDHQYESEEGDEPLYKLLQEHQERKARWETHFPVLTIASRTTDWDSN